MSAKELEAAAVAANAAGQLWVDYHRDHRAELAGLDAKEVDHLLALVVSGDDPQPWVCTWGQPEPWELEASP